MCWSRHWDENWAKNHVLVDREGDALSKRLTNWGRCSWLITEPSPSTTGSRYAEVRDAVASALANPIVAVFVNINTTIPDADRLVFLLPNHLVQWVALLMNLRLNLRLNSPSHPAVANCSWREGVSYLKIFDDGSWCIFWIIHRGMANGIEAECLIRILFGLPWRGWWRVLTTCLISSQEV
jgi:hypothetical protein